MNVSDYSCGAIKLAYGPNERIKAKQKKVSRLAI